MNNNQDNLNINPEINNQNNPNQYTSRFFNNQNGFIGNQQQPQNIISQSQPENLNNNINQSFTEQPNKHLPNPTQPLRHFQTIRHHNTNHSTPRRNYLHHHRHHQNRQTKTNLPNPIRNHRRTPKNSPMQILRSQPKRNR